MQVSALYVVGEESAEWYYTEVNSATGAMTKRQALARHPANNRGNQVAREKYCSGILKEGVLPELRAERAQTAVGAGGPEARPGGIGVWLSRNTLASLSRGFEWSRASMAGPVATLFASACVLRSGVHWLAPVGCCPGDRSP